MLTPPAVGMDLEDIILHIIGPSPKDRDRLIPPTCGCWLRLTHRGREWVAVSRAGEGVG